MPFPPIPVKKSYTVPSPSPSESFSFATTKPLVGCASILSVMPSLSLSISYTSGLPTLSVLVRLSDGNEEIDVHHPFTNVHPLTIPLTYTVAVMPLSVASVIPSPSLSRSIKFGMPLPSLFPRNA